MTPFLPPLIANYKRLIISLEYAQWLRCVLFFLLHLLQPAMQASDIYDNVRFINMFESFNFFPSLSYIDNFIPCFFSPLEIEQNILCFNMNP